MSLSKVILVFLKAFIELLIISMKRDEEPFDADGLPLNIKEYDRCGFLLASFRDTLSSFDENFSFKNDSKNG